MIKKIIHTYLSHQYYNPPQLLHFKNSNVNFISLFFPQSLQSITMRLFLKSSGIGS